VSLAVAAPIDQLYTATELNEWALAAALYARDPARWAGLEAVMVQAALEATPPPALPPVLDEASALDRLVRLATLEARPSLRATIARAASLGLGWVFDDEGLSIGEGEGHASFGVDALPHPELMPWSSLRNVPVALVTGSNGKTTTVRLLAACAQAQGWRTGYACVLLDGKLLVSGDFSGPMGARTVLRDSRVQAAVIEAARGGLLRRGSAANRADVAIVTNLSLDHMGGYGIDDLDGMAAVKLIVANLVGPAGLVVLNADDPVLVRHAAQVEAPVGWFALDFDAPLLQASRAAGAPSCGVRDRKLMLTQAGTTHELGTIDSMPLTIEGSAAYNIANLAGAALAAMALGISPAVMREVFAHFGGKAADNPGRLMRYTPGGLQVIVDYAHNPEGLRGALVVARKLAARGRLLLLLGQAGDRGDADIAVLGGIAAQSQPDLVVIKEMKDHLRGRAPGEVPGILRRALLEHGIAAEQVLERDSEIAAARAALAAAREGDAVLLLVHGVAARAEVLALIERLQGSSWRAGDALPE
jgi:UDP-N-acetylmuramyl tripeptide synthase